DIAKHKILCTECKHYFFFFQAEDGIRDFHVTGVQTCALPISINERTEILQYWINRNKSKVYSLKLNALIKEEVNVLGKFPMIGKDTDVTNVKVKIIKDYLLYY